MPSLKLTSELRLSIACDNPAQLLAEETGLSVQQIKQAMQKGAVWCQLHDGIKRLRRAKKQLNQGDKLFIYYDEQILQQQAQVPQLIEDCQSYSLWYKPYGVLSQGSKWGDHTTINRLVEQLVNRPTFLIHRLDRATSGLLVVGHSKKITAAIAAQFEQRSIKKYYQAVVEGQVTQTLTLDTPIDGKHAHSKITPLNYDAQKHLSLIRIDITTGRKHQIRRHCAEIGHPIVGDRLYGSGKFQQDLQLSSCGLAFECPIDRQWRSFELPSNLRLKL